MKKIKYLIFSVLFLIPVVAYAADNPKVTALTATVSGRTINYSGTMESGAHAVMCKLYSGDNEIDYLSSAVDSNKFEGSFVVSEVGTYDVKCANYEGGEYKIVEAVVEVESATDEVTAVTSPKTYDAIIISIAILAISGIGIAGSFVYYKKSKQK